MNLVNENQDPPAVEPETPPAAEPETLAVYLVAYVHRHGRDEDVYSDLASAEKAAWNIMSYWRSEFDERASPERSAELSRLMDAGDLAGARRVWLSVTDEYISIEEHAVHPSQEPEKGHSRRRDASAPPAAPVSSVKEIDLERWVRDIVDAWDQETLYSYAVESMLNNLEHTPQEQIVEEYNDFYAEGVSSDLEKE